MQVTNYKAFWDNKASTPIGADDQWGNGRKTGS
jgi:hypothetical protein